MLKKLLFAGALTASLAVLALVAEPVSADYYDCNGNLRTGDPRPSECHYYLTPTPSSSSTSDTSDSGRTRVDVTDDSNRTTTTTTTDSDRTRVDVTSDIGRDYSYPTYTTDRTRVDVTEETGRNYTDDELNGNYSEGIVETDPDNYSKKYEIRNARKYCMRDYCYIIYDYCYDLTHCEEKVYKMPREEYNYGNDWRDMFEDYYDRYRDRYYRDDCDRYSSRCVYRGFYFGGFHNGYWYYR